MLSSRGTSPSISASSVFEMDGMRKDTERLRRALLVRLRRKQEQEERQLQRARLEAVKTKRSQWKAASARYYEKHPEVREKKRLKMAEQRAAKKAARRRHDPAKNPSLPYPLDEADEGLSRQILQSREAVAVVSLLCMQQPTKPNPFPVDLPPSSDPGTSSDDEIISPAHPRKRQRPANSSAAKRLKVPRSRF
ncbi:hypothetical protein C8R47DRAFT_1073318 [Mycena vitilis]|nr:hypothetical protein C8R47DRAFT_1080712 [Mycena vitilis]KAJ6483542.1 hypothetical protein C8R47DRAFT_1073318 [Mycena vitilis]